VPTLIVGPGAPPEETVPRLIVGFPTTVIASHLPPAASTLAPERCRQNEPEGLDGVEPTLTPSRQGSAVFYEMP